MADLNQDTHWQRTKTLMLVMMGLWVVFSFVLQVLAIPLNAHGVPYLGIPLGAFLAAQASLIAFAAMLFVFARRQDTIDRDHGFDEQA
jgi:putative solute:sodium symporter small subunit